MNNKFKITVIDDMFLSSSQSDMIEKMGETKIFSGVPESKKEAMNRISNSNIITVGWTNISDDMLKELPNLKLISVWASGYDYIDVISAKKRGVLVTNIPGYAAESVAEHTFTLIFALAKNLIKANSHVRSGEYQWKKFCGVELNSKTIGIIGTGSIGSKVAQIANCFGMRVIAYTKKPSEERANKLNLEYVELEYLLKTSDIVTLHLPLTDSTSEMFTMNEFKLMKKTSFFINTARAAIINQNDLIQALNKGIMAGAGLDDIVNPTDVNNPLYLLDNVVLTPHNAFHTTEALIRKTDICISNIQSFINNSPQNVVNM